MDGSRRHQAEAIARQVLNEWKPCAWGTSIAGTIDLTDQIQPVADQLDRITTVNDAAAVVAAVFAIAFPDRAEQFTRYTCTSVGARLYHDFRSAGLIH